MKLASSSRRGSALASLRRSRSAAGFVLVTMLSPILLSMIPRPALADASLPPAPPFETPQANLSSLGDTSGGAIGYAPASINPSTGALRTSIDFELPKARGAVQPRLSLTYSSSGSFGLGGNGWTLALPSIERHNLSGGPQYNDPDPSAPYDPAQIDRFTYGGEPLVPICRIDQNQQCLYGVSREYPPTRNQLLPGEQVPGFTSAGWYYYRLATETGALLRFFWSPDHTRWVVQDRSGASSEYGVPSGTTDFSATDRDAAGNIFRWNLFTQYDAQRTAWATPSNGVLYTWTQMTNPPFVSGVVGRSLGYLTDVYDTPRPGDSAPTTGRYAHHAHLVYTAPGSTPGSLTWTPSTSTPVWLAHPTHVLSRVDVTSQDLYAVATRQQLRRYYLTYPLTQPMLLSVQLEGNCPPAQNNYEDSTSQLLPDPSAPTASACTRATTRPATQFTYQEGLNPPFQVVPLPSLSDGTRAPLLFDINGDSLPDIIDVTASSPVVWINSATALNTFTSQPIALAATNVLDLSSINKLGSLPSFASGMFQMDGRLDMLWSLQEEWFADGTTPGTGGWPVTPQKCPTPNEDLFCDVPVSYSLLSATQAGGAWSLAATNSGSFPLTAVFPENSDFFNDPSAGAVPCHSPPCLMGGEHGIGAMDMNADGIADLVTLTDWQNPWESHGNVPFYWWQYSIRFSNRTPNGQYQPFMGNATPGATTSTRTDVHMGDVPDWAQPSPSECANGNCTTAVTTQFADLDGDGITDIVELAPGVSTMTWWPGHGDGVFGMCADGTVDCAKDFTHAVYVDLPGALPSGVTVNNVNTLTYGVHDVTGDGLADIVAVDPAGGYVLYVNDGGSPPTFQNFGVTDVSALGISGPLTGLYFADMDGNGVDDVIVQGKPAGGSTATKLGFVETYPMAAGAPDTRVGALTDIDNGLGAHVHVTYDAVANLSRAGAGSMQSPTPLHAVTAITTSDGAGDSYTTRYAYTGAVFDARDRAFLGFEHVTQTSPGLSTAEAMKTDTYFFYGACGGSALGACPTGLDYKPASYRGLPTLVEVRNSGEIYLSTTHHSYASEQLYVGGDGRVVRRVYDAQDDVLLYDTSSFNSSTQTLSIADTDVGSMLPVPVRNANYQHLERTTTPDAIGNIATVTDLGDITGKPDAPVVQTTTWEVPPKSDPVNNWIWRPQTVVTGASATDPLAHSTTYGYDSYGNVTDVSQYLSSSMSLPANAFGAPTVTETPAGLVNVAHVIYDTVGLGNVMTLEALPSGSTTAPDVRCTAYTYDAAYARFRTSAAQQLGCTTSNEIITQYNYDGVAGLVTMVTSPSNAVSTTGYDGFGRPTSFAKPDPTTGVAQVATTTVSYFDNPYGGLGQVVHVSQAAGATFAAKDTYLYKDGLGRQVQVAETGDLPNQWVISGQVIRDARGRVVQSFPATFVTADANSVATSHGGALYSGAAPTGNSYVAAYDVFNRVTETMELDGTVSATHVYHALSVDNRDSEQAMTAGQHVAAYTTTTRNGHGQTVEVDAYGNGGEISTVMGYAATGELISVYRFGKDANGPVSYTRIMVYDTMGRLLQNLEPNTAYSVPSSTPGGPSTFAAWTYAHNAVGDLIGARDARGCGENVAYDSAGRVVSEDYAPCASPPTQPTYSAPQPNGDGTEAYYLYEPGTGLLSDVYDRASHVHVTHDARARVTQVQRQIAQPGTPNVALASRYAAAGYAFNATYDDRDRILTQTTGADLPQLLSSNTALNALYGSPSAVVATYSPRGLLTEVDSSYGPIIRSSVFEPDGRPDSIHYGDVAGTTASYTYGDDRLRLTEVKLARAAANFPSATGSYTPPAAGAAQPTQQTVLADDVIEYDRVNNPTLIADHRIDAEWPAGAKPIQHNYGYDDAYRLTSVANAFNGTSPDTFVPPIAAWTSSPAVSPVPVSLTPNRTQAQTFAYDGLGNMTSSGDDVGVFYDRSLGTNTNGNQTGTGGPNQLLSAQGSGGTLSASYDVAGNLAEMSVTRPGGCTGPYHCSQRYTYTWDEIGRLSAASRYDYYPPPPCQGKTCLHFPGTYELAVQVQYAYDAGGQRVLRSSTDTGAQTTYSAEVFPSLRLNRASWSGSAYEETTDTEAVYLVLGGQALGRVVYAPSAPSINGPQHVLLELTDNLSSTATVIDKDTSELVERTTYLAYGQLDSDYRPDRWNDFREDYKFTGKEDDVEMGLVYFGGRYYSPQIGRFISPDPMAIHALAADLNPYAYVGGHVTRMIDPDGFEETNPAPAPPPPPPPCDGLCSTQTGTIATGGEPGPALPDFLAPWSMGYDGTADYMFNSAEADSYGPVGVWAGDWGEGGTSPAENQAYGQALMDSLGIGNFGMGALASAWNPIADGIDWVMKSVDPWADAPRFETPTTPEGQAGAGAAVVGMMLLGDELEALDGLAMADTPAVQTMRAAEAGGAFASGRGAHTALVTVFRDGDVVAADTLVSGNMTAEEAALGFPRSSLATHTEARAVTSIPLQEGDTMIIEGQYAPCPTCKGAMNRAAAASGADIHYVWGDNIWSAGN